VAAVHATEFVAELFAGVEFDTVEKILVKCASDAFFLLSCLHLWVVLFFSISLWAIYSFPTK
jgi:hypothetical protein